MELTGIIDLWEKLRPSLIPLPRLNQLAKYKWMLRVRPPQAEEEKKHQKQSITTQSNTFSATGLRQTSLAKPSLGTSRKASP